MALDQACTHPRLCVKMKIGTFPNFSFSSGFSFKQKLPSLKTQSFAGHNPRSFCNTRPEDRAPCKASARQRGTWRRLRQALARQPVTTQSYGHVAFWGETPQNGLSCPLGVHFKATKRKRRRASKEDEAHMDTIYVGTNRSPYSMKGIVTLPFV